jgi:hypothetical protein
MPKETRFPTHITLDGAVIRIFPIRTTMPCLHLLPHRVFKTRKEPLLLLLPLNNKSNLEIMMENFILCQTQQNKEFMNQNTQLMNQNIHANELIKQLANKVEAIATHNKMLETQISQVAQQQAAIAPPAGTFPGQPQPNPKGHINAIMLRSGKELQDPPAGIVRSHDLGKVVEKDTTKDTWSESMIVDSGQTLKSKKAGENEKETPYVPPPPYKPPIPFPQRLVKPKNPGQFEKFIEMLKRLHIDIPFIEAITQIPSYAKFLKEILSNKKKLENIGTVECNAISENKLAPKLEDPGNFYIPCVIGRHIIDKALCELGSSVSLMPLTLCKWLGLGELKPTKMSLQLPDRTIKYPVGILENVPVRIGHLFIPTDFVIMDIKEDDDIPILLGRPFLASSGAIINVKRGKITFEVGDEKIEFIMSQFMESPTLKNSCCRLDIIERNVDKFPSEQVPPDILKAHLEHNIFQDKTPPSISQRKKGKRKTPMRWSDMFKWNPKDVEHNVNDVSLEEAPF